jgi:hypothetical protein
MNLVINSRANRNLPTNMSGYVSEGINSIERRQSLGMSAKRFDVV